MIKFMKLKSKLVITHFKNGMFCVSYRVMGDGCS